MLDGYKTREKDLEGRYDKIIDLEEDLKNMTEASYYIKNSQE